MGRTPLSQMILGMRLRAAGFEVGYFSYSATLSSFDVTVRRLAERLQAIGGGYALAGHSLGCILIRAALRSLDHAPSACFFLAPPNRVPRAATLFARHRLFRALTGDSGSRLADPAFMDALPVPDMPTRIYAGTAGPREPFDGEANDGLVAVSETRLDARHPVIEVPSLHTFIMNSRIVANDIIAVLRTEESNATPLP